MKLYKDSNELFGLVRPSKILSNYINFICLQTFGIFGFA